MLYEFRHFLQPLAFVSSSPILNYSINYHAPTYIQEVYTNIAEMKLSYFILATFSSLVLAIPTGETGLETRQCSQNFNAHCGSASDCSNRQCYIGFCW
jgi:hypothetical protein